MHENSISLLFQSSSPSGLLPGRFDKKGEPTIFEEELMRDNYWFVTFELPYILCKYRRPGGISEASGQTQSMDVSAQQSLPGQNARTSQFVPNSSSPDIIKALEALHIQLKNMSTTPAPISAARKEGEMMKYSIAFNNRIDPKNIVELTDECLYKEPEFFTSKCDLSYRAILESCEERKDHLQEKSLFKILKPLEVPTTSNEDVPSNEEPPNNDEAPNEAEALSNEEPPRSPEQPRNVSKGKVEALKDLLAKNGLVKGFVIDIPKLKHLGKKGQKIEPIELETNKRLLEHLSSKPRTAANSKKRFLRFSNWSPETAILCRMASSEAYSISLFFDRNSMYEKYFEEDVKKVENKWVTEVHLAFRQRDNTSHVSGNRNPRSTEDSSSTQDIGLNNVGQAAMGFRFDGDFFDQHWTCHYVESQDKSTRVSNPILDNLQEITQGGTLGKEPWKQRKVLELILFDSILEKIVDCSKKILEGAQKSVLEPTKSLESPHSPARILNPSHSVRQDELDLLSGLNYGEFILTRQKWNKVQHLLQVVQENIDENLGVIDLWKNRENKRKPDQPRWTRDDERRYRIYISKWTVLIDHKIQDLRRVHASIELFSTSVANKLDIVHGELEFRDAENIRLFTYATVIFLPINFATGLFSMNGVPSTKVGLFMFATALAALAATAVALFSAKRLARGIIRPAIEWAGEKGHKLIRKPRVRPKKPANKQIVTATKRPRPKPPKLWFDNAQTFISNRFKRHPKGQANDSEA